jgi:hypothetical protein
MVQVPWVLLLMNLYRATGGKLEHGLALFSEGIKIN